MAQRFRDRILEGTGVSNKKFESEFGKKMLEKMGWKQTQVCYSISPILLDSFENNTCLLLICIRNRGEGLGKQQQGNTDCIQIKRREEGLGVIISTSQIYNQSITEDSCVNPTIELFLIKLGVSENKKGQFEWNDTWWENSYNSAMTSVKAIKNEHSEAETVKDSSSSEDETPRKRNILHNKRVQLKNKKTKTVLDDKKSKKSKQNFDHLFSSCSSSSDEEISFKKNKKIPKKQSEDEVKEKEEQVQKKTKKIAKKSVVEIVEHPVKSLKDKKEKKNKKKQ